MARSNALKPPRPYDLDPVETVEPDGFSRFVGISIALHLGLLAMLTVKAVFYPTEPIQLERAIRVDMVGLPEKRQKLPPELKAPPKAETKKPEPKVEPAKVDPAKPEKIAIPDKTKPPKPENDKINLSKAKQSQDAALKRLEALRKLEEEAASAKAKEILGK